MIITIDHVILVDHHMIWLVDYMYCVCTAILMSVNEAIFLKKGEKTVH